MSLISIETMADFQKNKYINCSKEDEKEEEEEEEEEKEKKKMELVRSIWFWIAVNVFMGDHAKQRSVLVENTSRRPRFTLAKPHDHFIHFPADNSLQLQSITLKHLLVCIYSLTNLSENSLPKSSRSIQSVGFKNI